MKKSHRSKSGTGGVMKKARKTVNKVSVKKTLKKTAVVKKRAKTVSPKAKKIVLPVKPAAVSTPAQNFNFSSGSMPVLEKEIISVKQVVQELPRIYGTDRLVILTRDPRWLYAYWELGEQNSRVPGARLLRVYDITLVDFNGANANSFFDVEIPADVDNWYIDTRQPARSWCVELGVKDAQGKFQPLLRSNTALTPLEGPSEITDEEWMIPEITFARLYAVALGDVGAQSSSPGKLWQGKLKSHVFSGLFSSSGISVTSPGKVSALRKFWMEVDCDLIVYGATEPDAKVTVQGIPVKLRKDGSFSLRFTLPDGKQVIPVEGVSADGKEKRTITPVIRRQTE